jgi:hypothetical protein
MSGAAGIAAAKNRRTKADPNQKPSNPITCGSKSGSCPLPPPKQQQQQRTAAASVFDEESLQITGPMPLMHVLKVHEQRLNKIDEKLNQHQPSPPMSQALVATSAGTSACDVLQACDAECYDRLSVLEEKVQMLEEVIMNLQLTLTNVQSFAMETSLAMMKLQNQIVVTPLSPISTAPASTAPAPAVPASTVPAPAVPAPAIVPASSTPADSLE